MSAQAWLDPMSAQAWLDACFPKQPDASPNTQVEADRVKAAAQWQAQAFTTDADRAAKDAMLASGKVTQEQLDRAADLAAGLAPGKGGRHYKDKA